MSRIDFHADDYILTQASDKDILDLCKNQQVQSISLMVNMDRFDKAIPLLKTVQERGSSKIKMSIHLNFMEGRSCAQKELVPDLVDDLGYFTASWGKLLKWSYTSRKRAEIKRQLRDEILAQTHKTLESKVLGNQKLRFDSHQHPHMIPVVWEALLEAVDILKDEGYETEFIRNSRDIMLPYLKHPKLYLSYSPVNLVKCCILNFFAHRVAGDLKKRNLPKNLVCGVLFSDYMDYDRLKVIIPSYIQCSEKSDSTVEVLFHPGKAISEELTGEFSKEGFSAFHLSANRTVEKESLKRLVAEFA